jgi:hypothetical protein
MKEKRKLPRPNIMFYSRVFDRKTGKHLGYLGNITTDGMMIICDEPIDSEITFELRVELPEDVYSQSEMNINAKSLWCNTDIDPKFFNVGFKFLSIDDNTLDLIEGIIKDFNIRDK